MHSMATDIVTALFSYTTDCQNRFLYICRNATLKICHIIFNSDNPCIIPFSYRIDRPFWYIAIQVQLALDINIFYKHYFFKRKITK